MLYWRRVPLGGGGGNWGNWTISRSEPPIRVPQPALNCSFAQIFATLDNSHWMSFEFKSRQSAGVGHLGNVVGKRSKGLSKILTMQPFPFTLLMHSSPEFRCSYFFLPLYWLGRCTSCAPAISNRLKLQRGTHKLPIFFSCASLPKLNYFSLQLIRAAYRPFIRHPLLGLQ